MTPLFQEWLLERLEEGYLVGIRRAARASTPFPHVAINGWYYSAAPRPATIPRTLARALLQSRGRDLPFVMYALVLVNSRPDDADWIVLDGLVTQCRDDLLPRYRRLVENSELEATTAAPNELTELVDRIGRTAGEYFWSLSGPRPG